MSGRLLFLVEQKEMVCPACANKKVSVTNSLASLYPELAVQWHPTKNGELTPEQYIAGSNVKVWWKCPKGPDHEWQNSGNKRIGGRGCPACANQKVSVTNSLASLYLELAVQWHPTKNGELTPEQYIAGSGKKVWWKCPKGPDHEWQASGNNRVKGRGCPMCSGRQASVTNSLTSLYPELAAQWHPTKNEDLTPEQFVPKSGKKVWWKCPKGPDHEWQASGNNRVKGRGCPMCSGRQVSVTNSLASLHLELAAQWHPTKNGDFTPEQYVAGSERKVWWKCPKGPDHEWQAHGGHRIKGTNCPACSGKQVSVTNSLASLYPELAKQWHPTKNGDLTPDIYVANSSKAVYWICPTDPQHFWKTNGANRVSGTDCPACIGWNVVAIRSLVSAILPYLGSLTPAELYLIAQQGGALNATGKGKGFLKALTTGRFPIEELEKFEQQEPSLVDEFLNNIDATLPDAEEPVLEATYSGDELLAVILDGQAKEHADDIDVLPIVQAKDALAVFETSWIANADEEAVEFFVSSALAKLWKATFKDESKSVKEIKKYKTDAYGSRVKDEFLKQYETAINLKMPDGYAFMVDGKIAEPFLMQKLVASQIAERRRFGNWSGTGAGKNAQRNHS